MLYHVSFNSRLKKLVPKVPRGGYKYENPIRKLYLKEEEQTARICFSTTISGCLSALSLGVLDDTHIDEIEIKIPSFEEVPDACLTNEVWSLKECKVKKIGKIEIIDRKFKFKNSKKGYRLPFNEYKWKWIEKVS